MPSSDESGDTMYDPRHEHEPEIPPAFDDEGRCLVCCLLVERDNLNREHHQIRKTLDDAGVPSLGFDQATRVAVLAWKATP